jgi:hypothetical protein
MRFPLSDFGFLPLLRATFPLLLARNGVAKGTERYS